MNKRHLTLLLFLSMTTILMITVIACSGQDEESPGYEDQVQAGVAATLTKEAFVKSIESARQTEVSQESPRKTQESVPTATFTFTPEPTPTPTPEHVMLPGSPSTRNMSISDIVTVDLAKDKTALGDNYSWNRLERPYTSETMEYRDYLDIYQVDLWVSEPWVYITTVLIGNLPGEGDISYSVELDVDHDGRGDFLVTADLPPDSEWTTDGVAVIVDGDEDIGGVFPMYMEDPVPGQNGYEREIFRDGVGEDRDLAWVRRAPANRNHIQLAFKYSMVGNQGFLWSVWTDEGLRDPSLFDFNDHFSFDEAGSPNKGNYRYPVKAVALVDSTCRMWYGYVPSGIEPGLCFTEEQVVKQKGYGWCYPSPTENGCGGNPCMGVCPTDKFCVPCKR